MKLVNLSIKLFVGIVLVTFIVASSTENSSEMTSTVSSESELNHGIFLNDKLFKYKNTKKAALTKSKAKTTAVTKSQATTAKKATTSNKVAAKKDIVSGTDQTKNLKTHMSEKTIKEDGPILQKCWMKYFKNTIDKQNKNVSFIENRQFFEQPKYYPNYNRDAKLNGEWEFIRDKHFFRIHLFENMISVTTSRHVNFNKFKNNF